MDIKSTKTPKLNMRKLKTCRNCFDCHQASEWLISAGVTVIDMITSISQLFQINGDYIIISDEILCNYM